MWKKLSEVYIFAFVLNLIWENAHSFLYVSYQGASITEAVLIRAATFDALFITGLFILFSRAAFFKKRLWLSLVIGIIFAVTLEIFALQTGRWQYNSLMPIIPFLNVGLTPSIQLGLLGYLAIQIFKSKLHTDGKTV